MPPGRRCGLGLTRLLLDVPTQICTHVSEPFFKGKCAKPSWTKAAGDPPPAGTASRGGVRAPAAVEGLARGGLRRGRLCSATSEQV